MQNSEIDNVQGLPYKHCLNCGTELKGKYCHICGQEVVDKKPTFLRLVVEYLNETFIWDPNFFRTFWTLIRRPGQLTNDYLSGKIISQESPLKLNMFLLLVFLTLFIFFSGSEKLTNSVHSMTSDERVFPGVQLELLMDDQQYVNHMQESPRDTVYLLAPLFLVEQHPTIISNLETKEDTQGKGLDKWVAILPRVLIEDQIIITGDDGYYYFNPEAKGGKHNLDFVNTIWTEMVRLALKYFPLLLLLTAPFLSISLSLVQRKSRVDYINHLIFSLHYTALLEFVMICIYILYLTISPSMKLLECIMVLSSCTYLTLAFRRVYAIRTWGTAIVKSLLTSLIYLLILQLVFVVIFIIACVIVAINMI